MNKKYALLCINLTLSLLISACGGSSGNSNNVNVTMSPGADYDGNRNPVLLKPDNTMRFTRTLFGMEQLFLNKSNDINTSEVNGEEP